MAIVPFSFDCSKDAGFVMGPNEQRRFGYVIALHLSARGRAEHGSAGRHALRSQRCG